MTLWLFLLQAYVPDISDSEVILDGRCESTGALDIESPPVLHKAWSNTYEPSEAPKGSGQVSRFLTEPSLMLQRSWSSSSDLSEDWEGLI